MLKKSMFVAVINIFSVFYVFGQTPQTTPTPNPSPQSPEIQTTVNSPGITGLPLGKDVATLLKVFPVTLEIILTEAEKQTTNYQETFKNLLAVETKTFEEYNKNGEVKDQTVVESNFLVYQSVKDNKVSSELRNIVKVDGKLIPDSQAKSDQFFAELEKEKTLASELEKIQKAGSRYDKTLETYGLTLNEAIILSDNLRPFFDFKLMGTENYQGNDVYVVSYQQTKKSPFVTLNDGSSKSDEPRLDFKFDLPNALKNNDALLRGKLWIDMKTFQVRREERELTIQADSPLIILESIFEYQPSDYEILVPKQISISANEIKKKDDKYFSVKDTRLTFDYSKFRKSNVEVIILDDQ